MFDGAKGVEGADGGQGDEFLAVEGGNAGGEIVDGGEGAVLRAGGKEGFGRGLAEAFGVVEADAEGESGRSPRG